MDGERNTTIRKASFSTNPIELPGLPLRFIFLNQCHTLAIRTESKAQNIFHRVNVLFPASTSPEAEGPVVRILSASGFVCMFIMPREAPLVKLFLRGGPSVSVRGPTSPPTLTNCEAAIKVLINRELKIPLT